MPNRTYVVDVESVRKYRGSGKRGPITGIILDRGFVQFSWSDGGALGDPPVVYGYDQATFLEEGVMGFSLDGSEYELHPGGAIYIPAEAKKQAWSKTSTRKVEIFGTRYWERWEFAAHQLEHETKGRRRAADHEGA